MSERPDFDTAELDPEYAPIVRLWTLRALLNCGGVHKLIRSDPLGMINVAHLLEGGAQAFEGCDEARAMRELSTRLQEAEASQARIPETPVLAQNLARLAERVQLNELERDLLHFVIVARAHTEFSATLGFLGPLMRASLCRLISECLGVPLRKVQVALDDRSKLCRSALMWVDDSKAYVFDEKIVVLQALPETLMLECDDLIDLLGSCVVRTPKPRLALADYPHLEEDIGILRRYLAGASLHRATGVNILLYGAPGTGKTEFARAMAADLGSTLMEIPVQEPGGRPRAGRERFESFRFAQSLLAGSGYQILLFDEVEDVFGGSPSAGRLQGGWSSAKGWINQLLECNAVPTFWIVNDIEVIDPAYRRRFDLALHLDVPPAAIRRRLIDKQWESLAVPESWRDVASRHDRLVPAIIERVAKVGAVVCAQGDELQPQQVLTRVMNHALSAQGCAPLPTTKYDARTDYRLDLLNADCDLERLAEGLKRLGQGRLCLAGPPGTGKSAFGRHLAEVLQRPLLVRRASDLLSPYVGEAERNIATMFEQAQRTSSVLLLDEAEGYLRERLGAQRPWEYTQVNEMLTQMETFEGVFVASTNLLDCMDEAALRRFDACIRFGYLRPQQVWEMFASLAQRLSLDAPDALRPKLDILTTLTPGDFAAVARGARLDVPRSAAELVGRLERAFEIKGGKHSRSIGFTNNP